MTAYEFWRRNEGREVAAVKLRDGGVVGCAAENAAIEATRGRFAPLVGT